MRMPFVYKNYAAIDEHAGIVVSINNIVDSNPFFGMEYRRGDWAVRFTVLHRHEGEEVIDEKRFRNVRIAKTYILDPSLKTAFFLGLLSEDSPTPEDRRTLEAIMRGEEIQLPPPLQKPYSAFRQQVTEGVFVCTKQGENRDAVTPDYEVVLVEHSGELPIARRASK
jgi:hypothetical protein